MVNYWIRGQLSVPLCLHKAKLPLDAVKKKIEYSLATGKKNEVNWSNKRRRNRCQDRSTVTALAELTNFKMGVTRRRFPDAHTYAGKQKPNRIWQARSRSMKLFVSRCAFLFPLLLLVHFQNPSLRSKSRINKDSAQRYQDTFSAQDIKKTLSCW